MSTEAQRLADALEICYNDDDVMEAAAMLRKLAEMLAFQEEHCTAVHAQQAAEIARLQMAEAAAMALVLQHEAVIERLQADTLEYVEGVRPIWETLAEIGASVPPDAWPQQERTERERFDAWWDSPPDGGPVPDLPVSKATAMWIWQAALAQRSRLTPLEVAAGFNALSNTPRTAAHYFEDGAMFAEQHHNIK